MDVRTWTVVKFTEEDTVEAVPTTWLLGTECYWPPYPRDKVVTAIKNFEAPNTHWPSHKMEVFRNGTFGTYLEARRKLNMAQYTSDLSQDDEPQTRRIRQKKQISSSSDDEINTPQKGQKVKAFPKPPAASEFELAESHALLTKKTDSGVRRKSDGECMTNISQEDESLSQQISLSSNGGLKPSTSSVNDESLQDSVLSIKRNATSGSCCCCPIHKRIIQTDDEIKKIKKQYMFLTNIMADMKNDLSEIKENVSSKVKLLPEESIFSKFSFPINDENSLHVVENYLGIEENFQKTISEVATLGGHTVYDFIKRALTVLITNKFAAKYSFLGRKQKSSFSVLKISQLVLKAALHAKKGDQKEVEEAIAKWLRRANERKGC